MSQQADTFPGAEPPQTPKPPLNAVGRLWPILAIGFAILSMILLAVLLWPDGDDDTVTDTAEDSAELSCQVFAEAELNGFEGLSDDERFIQVNRLSTAGMLAWTAEAQDPGMEGFREAMERPRHVAAQMFVTEGPEFDEAMAGARAACADLDD
ncbi:hypothetical protein MWU75_05880 [Ornithinimicrobium sp. F0845]|uniref:hypothetical protein n=1 Tax=Ornithinimicrobium sp. F0845 TaxID=2926412 RepID=UPI001FF3591A|nr:hypothetical protein [Ornithinimicrobium sp. F0845]MCK0111664.1 hypothetical protein [Ornithinimicrobium sp. F0845]